MRKAELWFGCEDCAYSPVPNKNKSTDNWKVYDSEPCPKCGKNMGFHFSISPKKSEE